MNKTSYLVLPLIVSGCAFFSSEKAVQYNKDFNCNINAPIFTQFYNREDLIKEDDLWYDTNEKIVSGIAVLTEAAIENNEENKELTYIS